MKKKRRNTLRTARNVLDLPQDILYDLPQVRLYGNRRMVIEQHKGIIECTEDILRIALKSGMMRVTGSSFVLDRISADEVIVSGTILTLEFFS